MYQSNLAAWLATVPTRTPGERQAAARLADISFRYDRLARLELKLANANLESSPAKARKVAQDALDGVRGLAAMCEGVDGPRHVSAVASIRPAIPRVAEIVDEAACRILDHLGLDSQGPPVARAQAPPERFDLGPDYGVADPSFTD